jgi:hypothetical protein
MTRNIFCLTVFLVLIGCTLPLQAQPVPAAATPCSYSFTTGAGNSYLAYCVTANGNITQLETPSGYQQINGGGGEGYGICNETPAQNYTDYATSDTGNWNPATLVSKTTSSVKIARTTSDGNWTLTQTITQVAKPPSITIVMVLKNNQAVAKVAYLLRYADVNSIANWPNTFGATVNSAFAWSFPLSPPLYGLQLQNVGTPPFGFWQGYAQTVNFGPNACAFAANASAGFAEQIDGSVLMVYAGAVPAHGTRTVKLTYQGL